MVTDYEAAWIALGEFVAGKSQHGQRDLLARMAELAAEHRVPAGELSRLLRLHGVEVERARSIDTEPRRDERTASDGDSIPGGRDDSPAIIDRGGHDGSSNGGAAAGSGAGGHAGGGRRGEPALAGG